MIPHNFSISLESQNINESGKLQALRVVPMSIDSKWLMIIIVSINQEVLPNLVSKNQIQTTKHQMHFFHAIQVGCQLWL